MFSGRWAVCVWPSASSRWFLNAPPLCRAHRRAPPNPTAQQGKLGTHERMRLRRTDKRARHFACAFPESPSSISIVKPRIRKPRDGIAATGATLGKGVYRNFGYHEANTNNGVSRGSTVGRDGEIIPGWLTYWASPRNTFQLMYQNNFVDPAFIPGGGAWQDYSAQNEFHRRSLCEEPDAIRAHFALSVAFQWATAKQDRDL
jgi:hypothetical protein